MIGFSKIYFFFDDVEDDFKKEDYELMQAAESYTGFVKVVHCSSKWFKQMQQEASPSTWKLYGDYLTSDLIARQVLAVEQAIQLSCNDAMDWILHIDIDELIYWPPLSNGVSQLAKNVARDWFSRIPPHIDGVRFYNAEAAPENCELMGAAGDYFQEISLFKVNPSLIGSTFSSTLRECWPRKRAYFTAYQNGKSAVRCQRNIIPKGSHGFERKQGAFGVDSLLLSLDAQQLCKRAIDCPPPQILHFPHASLTLWRKKYGILGRFPDVWCGKQEIPKACFHLQSRDAFFPICHSDDPTQENEARSLFITNVVFNDADMNARLLQSGLLVRYEDVSISIAKLFKDR